MKDLLKHFIKKDKKSKNLTATRIQPSTQIAQKIGTPAPSIIGRIPTPRTPPKKFTYPAQIMPSMIPKTFIPSPSINATKPLKVANPIRPNLPSAPSQIRQYTGLTQSPKLQKPRMMVTSETERPKNTLLR